MGKMEKLYTLSCHVAEDKLQTVLSVLSGEVEGVWVRESAIESESDKFMLPKTTQALILRKPRAKRQKPTLDKTGLGLVTMIFARAEYPRAFSTTDLEDHLQRYGYARTSAGAFASAMVAAGFLIRKWRGRYLLNTAVAAPTSQLEPNHINIANMRKALVYQPK